MIEAYTSVNPGPCDEGMYSRNGNFPCRDCGPGTFQDQKGQTDCMSCARGKCQRQMGDRAFMGSKYLKSMLRF